MVAAKLRWWAADYAVAVRGQLGTVSSRMQPDSLADGDPNGPLVVLIPGVYESWRFMLPLARKLSARGYRVAFLPTLGSNRRPVPEGAVLLEAELGRLPGTRADSAAEQVVLLGHSKGGLIGKQVLLNRLARPLEERSVEVLGLVAVATPFSGSRYAARARGKVLREFGPGSETIRRLSEQLAVNAKIVSILPGFDPHIPGDRTLPGAVEYRLRGTGHFRVLASAEGLEAIISGIESLRTR